MRGRHYSHARRPRGRHFSLRSGRRRLLATLLAAGIAGITISTPVAAATLFHGRVVHITDAATFSVLTSAGRRVRIRLAGTEPPPPGSAAAGRARRALAALIHNQEVEVRAGDREPRTGTVSARVSRSGVDVAARMVADGWLRADGRVAELLPLALRARAAGRGLWADAAATP